MPDTALIRVDMRNRLFHSDPYSFSVTLYNLNYGVGDGTQETPSETSTDNRIYVLNETGRAVGFTRDAGRGSELRPAIWARRYRVTG